jgi:RND superfamily putative drug exporter
MRRFSIWCCGHRKTVILSWIAGLIVIGMISTSVGADFTENFNLPASDSKDALDLLEERFPAQSGETTTIVFKADNGVRSPAVKAKMEKAFAQAETLPHVSEVANPYTGGGVAAISKDGNVAYATVQYDVLNDKLEEEDVQKLIADSQAASGPGLQVELGGLPIEEAEEEGGDTSFLIGLGAAMVVLLITFGSLVAMGLPILTALFALGIGIGLVTLGTRVVDTPEFATILAAMIGLGVGIDYALFILTRFRNGLDEGLEPRPAAVAAVDTAGRAVLFAGITVIISLMGMMLLGISFLYGVALAAALAVLFTMISALTLLPALLTIVGRRVDRLRIPGLGARASSTAEDTRWFRWSREIQRRPVLSAVLSAALLLLLCVPTLSLRLGSTDAGSDPKDKTTRRAYDLLAEGFGPGFNGPLMMVAALPAKGEDQGLVQLRRALKEEPGIAAVTPIDLNPARDTGVFQAYPTTSPQSEDTTKLLDHIRGDVIPPIEAGTGARLHVGGITAVFEDFGEAIAAKLPLFIGVVILLSALLLMAVFRSVLVPLKAIVMNLLSIGAAFGIIVAVFQWGWGADLIGVERTGPIISFFPIFLFAIVFGLSMDYEVFLMSRIHEEWERSHDASLAVTRGLALTGRVITAAAAIMITVFLSFMLSAEPITKLFGLGLASAVFIDAVIIRSVLVPSVMQLLGARAWWLPDWLGRVLPKISVEPKEGPPPDAEPVTEQA